MNTEMNKELGFLLFPFLNHLSVTKVKTKSSTNNHADQLTAKKEVDLV